MSVQIKKAVRERVYLKLVVTGPSGGGKTLGSIGIAKGLAPTGKIGVIDSENRSASYYASRFDFDVIELEAPFTTQKYLEALRAFIEGGYEVVVIDSLTHEWAASGGILDQKAAKDSRGGNSFSNWNEMKQLHNKFVETLLQSRIHVVCTLRSKMEYALEQDEKGRSTVRKVGLAPISSDGMEYEFGVMFDVERNSHLAIASKDRTGLFEGRSLNLDERVGKELAEWLASGAELAPVPPTGGGQSGPAAAAPTKAATPRPTQAGASAAAKKSAPASPSAGSAGASSLPTPATDEPPAEWVAAMVELCEVTFGMGEPTRTKLIAQWESEGPASLAALRTEVVSLRSIMHPESMAPTTAGEVINQLPRPEVQQISQEANDFVEGVDPTPADTDEAAGGISQIQYEALNTLIGAFKINRDALRSWAFKSGHLLPGANGPTLARMKAEEFEKLRTKLCNQAIAAKGETWSQRTVRIINSSPITTYQPVAAAS
jgi:hypothetical protein